MADPLIEDAHTVDAESFAYIYEQNVTVPLKSQKPADPRSIVRCNVYRPKGSERSTYPVLLTYGPYGKDIHYKDFHPASFAEVDPAQRSEHSCWETPDPLYWTSHGYAIVRADERGTGQSPGFLDTMSKETCNTFFDVVEWAAEQPWSSGKTGLLGVSYYAGSQWRVAAQRPKGLSAILPWEGMSDYYRDRCRQGGIFENGFITFWWNRQVVSNQYGLARNGKWGPEPVDGPIPEVELVKRRNDQTIDNAKNRYCDDEYYASKEFNLEDIEVPVLSVANWGGITVHLRGNVEGYTHAGAKLKYLRFITGRHDLPFFYPEEVEVQRSFLDAFLRDDDRIGWSTPGKVPAVDLVLRKGNIGVNKTNVEKSAFQRRQESEWPIARTRYTRFYLTPDLGLQKQEPSLEPTTLTYKALGSEKNLQSFQFTSSLFEEETEITGHVVAHLNVSLEAIESNSSPSDIDLFATLRYIGPDGAEVLYTGSAGDPVPLCKGWLRVSLRKVNESHPYHRPWLPRRDYLAADEQAVKPGEVYGVDIELWPTNVVVEKGGRIAFEVGSGDTKNSGLFKHDHPDDRKPSTFDGNNHLHFGPRVDNYVVLPIIPSKLQ